MVEINKRHLKDLMAKVDELSLTLIKKSAFKLKKYLYPSFFNTFNLNLKFK